MCILTSKTPCSSRIAFQMSAVFVYFSFFFVFNSFPFLCYPSFHSLFRHFSVSIFAFTRNRSDLVQQQKNSRIFRFFTLCQTKMFRACICSDASKYINSYIRITSILCALVNSLENYITRFISFLAFIFFFYFLFFPSYFHFFLLLLPFSFDILLFFSHLHRSRHFRSTRYVLFCSHNMHRSSSDS